MSTDSSPLLSSTPGRIALAATVLATLAVVAAAALWLSQPSVAYIDSSQLMRRYDGAIAARQQLQSRQREWSSNVQTLKAETSELGQRLTQASLSPKQVSQTRDSLQASQKRLARYSRAVEKKSQKLQQELMQPVYDQLNADIQAFGTDQGYDIVFGTVQGGNILYAADATNITDAFLEHIGNEGIAAPSNPASSEKATSTGNIGAPASGQPTNTTPPTSDATTEGEEAARNGS